MGDRSRLADVRRWVAQCRRLLRLDPLWAIDVESADMTDADATVEIDDAAFEATITIANHLIAKKDKEWRHRGRQVTAHEMIHLALRPMAEMVEQLAPQRRQQEATSREENCVIRLTPLLAAAIK